MSRIVLWSSHVQPTFVCQCSENFRGCQKPKTFLSLHLRIHHCSSSSHRHFFTCHLTFISFFVASLWNNWWQRYPSFLRPSYSSSLAGHLPLRTVFLWSVPCFFSRISGIVICRKPCWKLLIEFISAITFRKRNHWCSSQCTKKSSTNQCST